MGRISNTSLTLMYVIVIFLNLFRGNYGHYITDLTYTFVDMFFIYNYKLG